MNFKLYGLTHDESGSPVVRVPRVVKVQIGIPKGPDIQVGITKSGSWLVWCNSTDSANKGPHKIYEGPERKAAEWWYERALSKGTMKPPEGTKGKDGQPLKEISIPGGGVVTRRYPGKLAYFTFSRQQGDGSYAPDWDSIEAHGSYPTEIDIVFTDDEALQASYQMWTATELRCSGDGHNANRILSMAETEEEKAAAAIAKEAGSKYFPIVGCRSGGCGYAVSPDSKKAPLCKPHGRLQMQLIKNIRLGGVAQFDTTSFRSISQLFSCLHQFLTFTGNGDPKRGFLAGIPLKLVLRPFRVSPGGQAGTAYSVSIEFRAESVEALRSKIISAGKEFRQVMIATPEAPAPALKQIASSAPSIVNPQDAPAMHAEFYDEDEQGGGGQVPESEQVKSATESRTEALAARLRAQREPSTPAQAMEQKTPAEAESEPIPTAEPVTAGEDADIPDDPPPISDADDSDSAILSHPTATPIDRKGGKRK